MIYAMWGRRGWPAATEHLSVSSFMSCPLDVAWERPRVDDLQFRCVCRAEFSTTNSRKCRHLQRQMSGSLHQGAVQLESVQCERQVNSAIKHNRGKKFSIPVHRLILTL